jgi:hypothetical protein
MNRAIQKFASEDLALAQARVFDFQGNQIQTRV